MGLLRLGVVVRSLNYTGMLITQISPRPLLDDVMKPRHRSLSYLANRVCLLTTSQFFLSAPPRRCSLDRTHIRLSPGCWQIIFHSPPDLVSIRRVDEAVVIGAALSLSSSAFVLKILQVCPCSALVC